MRTTVSAFFLLLGLVTAGQAQNSSPKESPKLTFKGKPASPDALWQDWTPYTFRADRVDTLRIIALRVEFKPDTIPETTGDGTFDLSTPEAPTIDPPPHNKSYFSAQLQALANYYATVSNGKLVLQWDVFPEEENAAYRLEREMAYYGPDTDQAEAEKRLAELFSDAVSLADQQDNLAFDAYQSVIIFHAGVGNDISFDLDPTPNDISSAFLAFEDLRRELGGGRADFQGIPVQNGSHFVRNGIILPESQSQEGFEYGLLGTAAIMMGFQLGLPSLFNTENGATAVGRWALMDQGSGNFQGMLPAEPNAWEKVYMGWEKPIVVRSGEQFQVAAAREQLSPNRVYKIPISDDEYFLIENRQRDVNGDKVAVGYDQHGNRVEFKDPGQLVSDAVIGVVVRVDEYDFGLPGSGILIWHIDESVIREKLPENRINTDFFHRGVDLEEADAAQDIGRFYGFLSPGYGAENGIQEDAWYAENPIPTLVNKTEAVIFGPETMPSTASYTGAASHLTIYDFSSSAPVMQFSVRHELLRPGFPVLTAGASWPPLAGELDAEAAGKEIIVLGMSGLIHVWYQDGSSPARESIEVELSAPGQEVRLASVPVVHRLSAEPAAAPVLLDLDADGRDEILILQQDGRLLAAQLTRQSGALALEILWEVQLSPATRAALCADPLSREVFTATGNDFFHLSATGEILNSLTVDGPVVEMAHSERSVLLRYAGSGAGLLDLDSFALSPLLPQEEIENIAIARISEGQALRYVLKTTNGRVYISDGRDVSSEFELPEGSGATGLAVADLDGDGYQDLVFGSKTALYAHAFSGASLENFPVRFTAQGGDSLDRSGVAISEPIIISSAEDELPVVFITGYGGDLYALRGGEPVAGFPLAFTGAEVQTPAAADLDDDGSAEIIALSADGFLHVFQPGGVTVNTDDWAFYGGNRHGARSNISAPSPQTPTSRLMPGNTVYNYPNPVESDYTTIRYRLNKSARVKITIFDLSGQIVDVITGSSFANIENEVRWHVGDVQSGVYLAQVEAQADDEVSTVTFKIAVVK